MKLASALFYAAAAMTLLIAADALSPIGLGFNRTSSLPRGLYLARDMAHSKPLARGDIACFVYSPPDWARGRYFHAGEEICKHTMGLPGDVLKTVNGENFICHDGTCDSAGKILDHDSAGRPVQYFQWTATTIPPGQYYMGSTRMPNSFDSRYLGLIPKNIIVKTIVPLLVE